MATQLGKSSKNLLQEYFQAKKLDIPTYNTYPLSTSPPQYQSTVKLDKDFGSFSGLPKSQKKSAELSAARVALEKLGLVEIEIETTTNIESTSEITLTNDPDSDWKPKLTMGFNLEKENKETSEKYSLDQLFDFDWSVPNPIVIIDDLENVHKLASLETFIQNNIDHNIKLVKVAAHGSNRKKEANYVVRSSNTDAADHFITFLISKLILSIDVSFKLIVLTGDHFGGALEDIVTQVTEDNPKIKLRHVTCQDDCIEMIQSFLAEYKI